VDLERRIFLHELRERDAHLFLIDFRLRSMATAMTGSGKVIVSRTIGLSRLQIVSPVVTLRRPTAAPMSPATLP